MEAILQAHNCSVPAREILEALAQKFSASAERSGVVEVTVKQVWNWFQNRRYAIRAKASKTVVPAQTNMPAMPRDDPTTVRTTAQTSQTQPAPSSIIELSHVKKLLYQFFTVIKFSKLFQVFCCLYLVLICIILSSSSSEKYASSTPSYYCSFR
ncbi:protein SAWADEE HOMEODOMAIN HOMOLOG 2-like isoform X2 [Olea europaea var. sylvestris]|nr:protein SAWADEE HOMEODOMAIN HOMOLOG 2-like isoform X2 [Olea europaea var. sylvestris]